MGDTFTKAMVICAAVALSYIGASTVRLGAESVLVQRFEAYLASTKTKEAALEASIMGKLPETSPTPKLGK